MESSVNNKQLEGKLVVTAASVRLVGLVRLTARIAVGASAASQRSFTIIPQQCSKLDNRTKTKQYNIANTLLRT